MPFRPALAALAALALSSCAWMERTPAPAPAPAAETAPAPEPASAPAPAAEAPPPPPATTAAAAPPVIAVPAQVHPALWKIADADTTIWLFGTIHALPQDMQWEDARIAQAVATADSLTIETLIDREHPEKLAATLFGMGVSPGLPPFLDRIGADRRAALQTMIGRSGIPAAAFDRMETWAGAFLLVGVTLQDLGLASGSGAEDLLQAQFRAAHKPIAGLETVEQQLGFFDTLPEEAQRQFLVTLVEDPAQTRAEFTRMLAAWATGDEAAIAATFDEEIEISPKLREVLLHDRNLRWTDWLVARMAQPGKLFVAVGAGHLAGDDSVITMLRARGMTVERVQ